MNPTNVPSDTSRSRPPAAKLIRHAAVEGDIRDQGAGRSGTAPARTGKMKKAIVMAGGLGSRLWPLTAARPKPLVSVANRPVIAHILHWLRRHDFSEVLIALHYRAEEIAYALGTGHGYGLRITYQVEKAPRGTA